MHIQAHTFRPCSSHLTKCHIKRASSNVLSATTKPFNVSRLSGFLIMKPWNGQMKNRTAMFATPEGQSSSTNKPKRKIVEHITLIKAKEGLSEEEEKDMLDYLYTSQYQMGGIVALSLGRIADQNLENYTHAIFMRFQRKENLVHFYKNPFYLGVIKDHVTPYCHDILNADYESEVEDDILPIFRKGEEFNYGMEFVLLISFAESSLGGPAENALASLAKLTRECPLLIVQATQGSNFNVGSREFTHAVVIRFRSSEAFKIFVESSEYKDMWRSQFRPIMLKVLSINFSIDPVGTEIM